MLKYWMEQTEEEPFYLLQVSPEQSMSLCSSWKVNELMSSDASSNIVNFIDQNRCFFKYI